MVALSLNKSVVSSDGECGRAVILRKGMHRGEGRAEPL